MKYDTEAIDAIRCYQSVMFDKRRPSHMLQGSSPGDVGNASDDAPDGDSHECFCPDRACGSAAPAPFGLGDGRDAQR